MNKKIKMKGIEMKGSISISKVTCGGEPENDYVSIRIEDGLSSIGFTTVKMDIESFGRALLGLGHVPVEFELLGMDKVGKKFEHKTVEVMITHEGELSPREEDIDIAVSKHEVDGWIGSKKDCKNFHRLVRCESDKYSVYNVHYYRWVAI